MRIRTHYVPNTGVTQRYIRLPVVPGQDDTPTVLGVEAHEGQFAFAVGSGDFPDGPDLRAQSHLYAFIIKSGDDHYGGRDEKFLRSLFVDGKWYHVFASVW